MKTKETPRATLNVRHWAATSDKTRKKMVAWLRDTAKLLASDPTKISARFRARFFALLACVLVPLWLAGCAVNITPACESYREAVGPEVIDYANADGVIDEAETAILKADSEFQMQIKSGPTVQNAKDYSAKVGGPWLAWVDADAKLDAAKKKRRHVTKEDFDRAMQAVETGK